MANAVKEIVNKAKIDKGLKEQAEKIKKRVDYNYANGKKSEPPTRSNGAFIDDSSDITPEEKQYTKSRANENVDSDESNFDDPEVSKERSQFGHSQNTVIPHNYIDPFEEKLAIDKESTPDVTAYVNSRYQKAQHGPTTTTGISLTENDEVIPSNGGIDTYTNNRDTGKGAATVNSTEPPKNQGILGKIKNMSDSDKEEINTAGYGDFWGSMETYEKKVGKQNFIGGEFVKKKSSDLTNDDSGTTIQIPTWGKIAAGIGVVGVGGGLVLNLARSNGSLTNKQLYGQEPLY